MGLRQMSNELKNGRHTDVLTGANGNQHHRPWLDNRAGKENNLRNALLPKINGSMSDVT